MVTKRQATDSNSVAGVTSSSPEKKTTRASPTLSAKIALPTRIWLPLPIPLASAGFFFNSNKIWAVCDQVLVTPLFSRCRSA